MVTTGGARLEILDRRRRRSKRPVSTSDFGDAADGVAHLLGDQLGGVGVDHVGDLDHLALLHQQLDHVDGALGHAVGELLDGDRLGNDHLAHDLLARALSWARARSRSRRRRIEASERARSVSSSALTSVSLPRRRSSPRLTGFGSARTGDLGLAASRDRRSSASSFLEGLAGAPARRRPRPSGFFSSPRRRRAVSSARARSASSVLRRGFFLGLAALGLVALARRARDVLGVRGAAPVPRRRGAPRPRGPWRRRAPWRGHRSRPSESWRSTSPARGLRRAAARRAGRVGAGTTARRGSGAAARRGAGAAASALVSPGSTMRRFLRSTCTVLVRPCEKLWRTVSRSTPRALQPERLALLRDAGSSCRRYSWSRSCVPCVSADTLAAALSQRPIAPPARHDPRRGSRRGPERASAHWRSPAQRAAQHVSHLSGRMPNPNPRP